MCLRSLGINRKGKKLPCVVQCPHQRRWAGPDAPSHGCRPALRKGDKLTPTVPQTSTGASSVTIHSPEWSLLPSRAAVPFWPQDALWLSSLLGLGLVPRSPLTSEPPVVPPLSETYRHLALTMRQLAAGDREAKGQCMKQWRSDWSSADPAGSAALPSARRHPVPVPSGKGVCVSHLQGFFRSPSH